VIDRDPGLDTLLALDGEMFVIDPEGRHWVKFIVKRAPVTTATPHGLSYSLTLHAADGKRLVGFDNAHPVRARKGPGGKVAHHDHRHRLSTLRSYDYVGAASLLEDFWAEVESVLAERGVEL
jgi:hypothetical protein